MGARHIVHRTTRRARGAGGWRRLWSPGGLGARCGQLWTKVWTTMDATLKNIEAGLEHELKRLRRLAADDDPGLAPAERALTKAWKAVRVARCGAAAEDACVYVETMEGAK